ncbi:glycosyltransferase family 2 protein [Levilactobacillus fujinensis]|uniref:Glycosyltransferase family 2 protein n=1 Tax=Levilactobacillus fujinensis TaxID=2486024 RepID=A0ABW1TF80_9LACO|nr:glycosyltransferase family 2 protein [Levilactobacillus fujinensis]
MVESSVCAVVVTYNRVGLLQKCLHAILTQSVGVAHVLVVDNHSTDGTPKVVAGMTDSRLIYRRLDANYGGAGGFKRGISAAIRETADDFFWLMDDDTMPTQTALAALLQAREQVPQFGFLTANVRWKDDSPMNVPPIASDWAESTRNGVIKVHEASFVSLFVSRARVHEVGLPFADFYIWHDDTEFTLRLAEAGNGYYVPSAIVIHESQSNQAPLIYRDVADRIPRYYYLYRNEMYICRKHKSRLTLVKTFVRDIYVSLKVILVAPDHRLSRSITVLRGTMSGLHFVPKG